MVEMRAAAAAIAAAVTDYERAIGVVVPSVFNVGVHRSVAGAAGGTT